MRQAPYLHLRQVLTNEDLDLLRSICKDHLSREGIPCYALLDRLNTPVFLKIKTLLEKTVRQRLWYLNDFYMYTDRSFKTGWHMDTELFTFRKAINVWILLSPDKVKDPLAFIDKINDSPDCYYHEIDIQGDRCEFGNFCNGNIEVLPLKAIEADKIHTPEIALGDLLSFNPQRFHKTNVEIAKHCFVIKFVAGSGSEILSDEQVPAVRWPEVRMYNDLVRGARRWDEVVEGLRRLLKTPAGREALSAGFFPKQFEIYRRMAQVL
jgi:hypothetical protein